MEKYVSVGKHLSEEEFLRKMALIMAERGCKLEDILVFCRELDREDYGDDVDLEFYDLRYEPNPSQILKKGQIFSKIRQASGVKKMIENMLSRSTMSQRLESLDDNEILSIEAPKITLE